MVFGQFASNLPFRRSASRSDVPSLVTSRGLLLTISRTDESPESRVYVAARLKIDRAQARSDELRAGAIERVARRRNRASRAHARPQILPRFDFEREREQEQRGHL